MIWTCTFPGIHLRAMEMHTGITAQIKFARMWHCKSGVVNISHFAFVFCSRYSPCVKRIQYLSLIELSTDPRLNHVEIIAASCSAVLKTLIAPRWQTLPNFRMQIPKSISDEMISLGIDRIKRNKRASGTTQFPRGLNIVILSKDTKAGDALQI